jgi:hypothetical protein
LFLHNLFKTINLVFKNLLAYKIQNYIFDEEFILKNLNYAYLFYKLNLFLTSSAIHSAIASEEVAAGLGALRTCNMRFESVSLPLSKTKSSTKFPSISKALNKI